MKGAKSKGAAKADTKVAVKSKGAEKPAAKGRKSKAAKGRWAKYPNNMPKRPPSAFFVFMGEFREEFKQKNPNKSVCDVAQATCERWTSLSESEKAPFVAKANKLKGEYNKAIAAYIKGEDEDDDE